MEKLKLKIFRDGDAENPRAWDNLGTFAHKHSRYTLGEERIDDPIDFLCEKLFLTDFAIEKIFKKFNSRLNDIKKYLEERFFEEYIALPVYLYDHSGLTISTGEFSDKWDSGQVGYIYVDKAKVRKEYNRLAITAGLKQKVIDILKAEIHILDQYLMGDVYRFAVEDENGELYDSCGSFYGDDFGQNGMTDYLPEGVLPQLEGVEIEY